MGRLLGRIFHGTNHGHDALFNGVGSIGAEGSVGSAQHDAGLVALVYKGAGPVIGGNVGELGIAFGHVLAQSFCLFF